MIGQGAQTREIISLGPFTLAPGERLLTKDGAPVPLGARTLDVLIALVSRPHEVISKHDLMSQVWPDVTVEEGSLRFHVAALRKALGDGKNGARYIATLPARGYSFVAQVTRSPDRDHDLQLAPTEPPRTNLPNRLIRMLGRDEGARLLSTELLNARLVTIVGPGGVGKTTLAVAVGHDLTHALAGAVLFVDLGMVNDANLIAGSIASMLGLAVQQEDQAPGLIAYLRDTRMLLILDTCEHLIEAVASLVSRVLAAAPHVHILATSREPLRIEGEQVYRLPMLGCPPEDGPLAAAGALAFPATQLFVERAAASGAGLDLTDANAAIIASICRRLDGLPLAIELAAGRVGTYGLEQTAALLEHRMALTWPGRRSAPVRQRSLKAALDWSFELLSTTERMLLRRLAVFVGHFTMEAALAVATSASVDQALVFSGAGSLVAKSMLATRPAGATMRYQLLDTTRAYALAMDVADPDLREVAGRHAAYYRSWLEQTGTELQCVTDASQRGLYLAALANVGAALEWCFRPGGDPKLGIALACAATPVFLAMSLVAECRRWAERAILALGDDTRGGGEEMQLQAALGVSLMFMRGSSDDVRTALDRGLAIAEERGEALMQLKLLGPLRMFHSRLGQFRTALHYAKRSSALARTAAEPAAVALAHAMLGNSLYVAGDLAAARVELEAALAHGPGTGRTSAAFLGFNGYQMADVTMGQLLWVQGHPARATERARQAVRNAASERHPVMLSVALVWAIFVFFGVGDLAAAEEHVHWFLANAETHSLGPYIVVGNGFKGQLAIRSGNFGSGVESLQDCLSQLRAARYELVTTLFNISVIEGLAAMGRLTEGITLADQMIQGVEAQGDLVYLPELLRLKGRLLASQPRTIGDAEAPLLQSLALSRRQTARTWELRTTVDLAALAAARGRVEAARALLDPVFQDFAASSGTADFIAAERLWETLGQGDVRTSA